jgi:hypothetical protein
MSWPDQDAADAFLALVAAAPGGPPSLKIFDGAVNADSLVGTNADGNLDPPYVLVYLSTEAPSAEQAPDASSLIFDSRAIDLWAYLHCIGGAPQAARAARAVAGRVRAAVLDQVLTVPNRQCFPIRWREGQPPVRNELTGLVVFDQVDVYSFRSVPG